MAPDEAFDDEAFVCLSNRVFPTVFGSDHDDGLRDSEERPRGVVHASPSPRVCRRRRICRCPPGRRSTIDRAVGPASCGTAVAFVRAGECVYSYSDRTLMDYRSPTTVPCVWT